MDKSDSRKSIIDSVKTPLGFFTLVVLVCELILGGLAVRAQGTDFTILIAGMLFVLVLLVVSVGVIAARGPRPSKSTGQPAGARRYDVFVSSVLAGFQEDVRLQEEKRFALAVVGCLEQECKYSVYYAGREISSTKDFDPVHISARGDIDALRQSRFFLLIYPQRIVSSVIFEAGMALYQCEASIYFVRKDQDLPYLMRRLPDAVGNVEVYTYEDATDIERVIKRHRQALFEETAKKAV